MPIVQLKPQESQSKPQPKEPKQSIYINVLKLQFIGDAITIRTRTGKHFDLKKDDIVCLPDNAFGQAYKRMKVFRYIP